MTISVTTRKLPEPPRDLRLKDPSTAMQMVETHLRKLYDYQIKTDENTQVLARGDRPTAAPRTVLASATPTAVASKGTGVNGYMYANAQLAVEADAPVGLGAANAIGTGQKVALSTHVHKRDVEVEVGGTLVAVRRKINFVSGATGADNAGTDTVDITITGGGGGAALPFHPFLLLGG